MVIICTFQTVFAKGGGHSLDVQATLGYETLGLDWTVDPIEARKIVGDNITLQGNLDPQDLYKTPVCLWLFYVCKSLNPYKGWLLSNCTSLILLSLLQEEIKNMTIEMVRKFGKYRYIANLGHGITPQTPLESMTAFTEAVHQAI